ncbi:DNA cytosine methyltransferase [Sphingomonas sp. LHG3406-1]|uniref:DNA cytosine methyltransferase n=1 Tax=Sphingomonas sp. LHG3406-1 TaxID=2804617 RepID=UPI0026154A3F|nr:DNA cytosine methyltransferase [Sphingomonas sp. LHG3406-1]
MAKPIHVVDLFAGPGGLAEGFASVATGGARAFRIALSVEKEPSAFRTLKLRSFYRQFESSAPQSYYDYLAGRISHAALIRKHPREWFRACEETHQLELGAAGTDEILDPLLDRVAVEANGACVLVGGPPCQAYSLVGRARNKGIVGYVAGEDHRHFLYREYIRILKRLKPAVFVMENVKGILSSRVNGDAIFDRVLEDLRGAGGTSDSYRIVQLAPYDSPSGYVIRSELHGVPQARHRVILLGIRSDLPIGNMDFRLSSSPPVNVRDVIGNLAALRSGLSRGPDDPERWAETAAAGCRLAARACSRMGDRSRKAAARLIEAASAIEQRGADLERSSTTPARPRNQNLAGWLCDKRLEALPNHYARGHMPDDLARYAFVAAFAELWGRSPKADEFPNELAPAHANWTSGKFVDRFRAQRWNAPSSTITSHISKDGHYFIHPDPVQCRSLTVREAARLQTFPDNYFFEGNRTAQYVQVGNAVPPLLAFQIAKIVAEILKVSEVRAAA